MPRLVRIDTDWQTVSAVQDLLEVKLGSGQFAELHTLLVMVSSDETDPAENLQINAKRATGSFTTGSGGGTPTITKGTTNDAAHGLAVTKRNDTTQAVVGTGVLESIPHMCGVLAVLSGEWERTPTPELRQSLLASEALIVSLDEAPLDALTLRCVAVLEVWG